MVEQRGGQWATGVEFGATWVEFRAVRAANALRDCEAVIVAIGMEFRAIGVERSGVYDDRGEDYGVRGEDKGEY